MKEKGKSEKNLLKEITQLRRRLAELEASEQKLLNTEKALNESDKKYRLISENTLDVVWAIDPVTEKFTYISPSVLKQSGFKPEEIVDKPVSEILPSQSLIIFREKLAEHLPKIRASNLGSLSYTDKLDLLHKDGSIIHTEIKTTYLYNEEGELEIIGVTRDITEQKKIKKALGESEAKIRSLFDNIEIGVSIISPAMEILDINHFMRKRFPEVEISQRPLCFKSFNNPPSENICEGCPTVKTLKDGKVHEISTSREHSGIMRNYRIISAPIFNDEKEVTAAFEMVQDITEKLSLESQLRQAQKMEAVGRLAGGVAHDYNNMLGVILGYAELAMDKLDTDHEVYDDLVQIIDASKRSAEIVQQLLAFARKQTIAPRIIDLNVAVGKIINMLRRLIGEDIDLIWSPCHDLFQVKMDPTQIEQIMTNLCVNSRDAIHGVGKITIETKKIKIDDSYCDDHTGFMPGEYAMLAISDDGIGMDKTILENIFEPFYTTKDIGKGSGLGLAMVYGIVKQNDGFINVYSEPEKGTTFKIYLPREIGEIIDAPEEKDEGAPPHGNGETVLVVEDEISILKLTDRLLNKLGYNVLAADSPEKAIKTVEEYGGKIHLMITDVILPQMNGKELVEQIRKTWPEIKHLFMSGYTADIIAHRGMLEEGAQFIPKPFSMMELAVKVKKALENKGRN